MAVLLISQGRTVDFKNTIPVMTSNIGSSRLLSGITPDGNISAECEAQVMEELRASFKPEFLNRLDEIIMFQASYAVQYQFNYGTACRQKT